MTSRGRPWMPRVRAAIPKCTESFSVQDVCRVIGVDPNVGGARWGAYSALCTLTDNRELEKRTFKRGSKRTYCAFTRTATFREAEFNPETQRLAGEFLQGLAVTWRSARTRHFSAEHAQGSGWPGWSIPEILVLGRDLTAVGEWRE